MIANRSRARSYIPDFSTNNLKERHEFQEKNAESRGISCIVERISASVAVLEALARFNIVLVTTHDIELQDLLANYQMFHFRENADAKNLFSYKIQHGPCTTRNAIELLKIVGYPKDITDRAEQVTKLI